MTEFSKASQPYRRFARFARYRTLISVCIFAMASWSPGPVEAKKPLQPRLVFLGKRIRHLEKTIRALSQRECQTGTMDFSICPGLKETSTDVITTCVISPISGAGLNVSDMTVTFARPFRSEPIVDVTYNGPAFLGGVNVTLDVIAVDEDKFTVRQIADDYLPVSTQAAFYACPAALF